MTGWKRFIAYALARMLGTAALIFVLGFALCVIDFLCGGTACYNKTAVPPQFHAMPLAVLRAPFDHPDWIFELKYDGFRAIAHHEGAALLISRKGHVYRQFDSVASDLQQVLQGHTATLDGELVCLDSQGRPKFYDLLRHRGDPRYAAFDIMELDGRDLRQLPLIQRKAILRRLIPKGGPVLYVSHVDSGVALFERVCQMDLEGIVAKARDGRYDPERTTWCKVLNQTYSQRVGRAELFRKRR